MAFCKCSGTSCTISRVIKIWGGELDFAYILGTCLYEMHRFIIITRQGETLNPSGSFGETRGDPKSVGIFLAFQNTYDLLSHWG